MKTVCRAFTLIELLVAVAIVALLAALFFPVLASVREQGRKTACADNLHQLYLAADLYAEDCDRCLPPYDVRVDGDDFGSDFKLHPVGDQSERLVGCLQPYTHSRDIWFCPSDPFAHSASIAGDVRHQFLSYTYATPFLPYFNPTPRRIDAAVYRTHTPVHVFEPSELTLLTDSSNPRDGPPMFYSHNGQFNTIYLDGHVKASP